MVVEAVDPGVRLRKEVFAISWMPAGAVTVRFSGVVALRLPLDPVIVRPVVTRGPLLEVNCREAVPPALTVEGVKTACTMQGRPVTAKVTLPVKFPAGATLTTVDADDPNGRLSDGEAALRVKPAATFAFTVRLMAALALRLPLAPVTVRLAVVAAVEAAAVSVSTEAPPGATDGGLNAAVTPAGRPETDNVTLPVNPPVPATLTLLVAEDPAVSDTDEGVALRAMPGAAGCITENVSPAMVMVPVREAVVVFAATEYPTLLLPVPDAPLVMVIQLTLLTAVQDAVEDTADTATLPVDAPAPMFAEDMFSENGGAAAAWVTPSEIPAIVMAPDLVVVAVLAARE
jgi:hypothetical protein